MNNARRKFMNESSLVPGIIQTVGRGVLYNNLPNASGRRQNAQNCRRALGPLKPAYPGADSKRLPIGRDGDWRAILAGTGKRSLSASVGERLREQPQPRVLHFLFAPLKLARLDYLVQKAVEMGVSRLQPVITRHTQVARLNLERMHANAIEAAQQCGVLSLPEIKEPVAFKTIAGNADADRLLVFCDEDAEVKDPIAALAAARPTAQALLPAAATRPLPLAVLIGPEGGFAEEEREALRQRPNVVRI